MNTMEKQKAVFSEIRVSNMAFSLMESIAEVYKVPVTEIIQNALQMVLEECLKEYQRLYREGKKTEACDPSEN
ncbi:hypothetical protein [Candidatus Kuenenia stuttgartiensis]|uniref:Uncharacterized protein n=1 Tax=Kuenenia stuttgartiensis TaxID=174633 RepID=A0A2C9CAT7_KUEST|nr:hypothetical protein [Candidatus Kuenenia stuttgartiensis]SOH02801.1 hypothetical protein KSMBR1_0285 [Candidatus Kuenenia stuttgartiensis]